ncbi:hypothetical protein [Dickeya solani]|uniref:Virion structural protein n=1 Tax=Dickeya solani TaxID=1089444 RepID=A0ABU4EIR2_9GAMM|nr:hypothetical protein [Dickeya solani]MCA6999503.1 hypothetical protein [Dickeya solani]MCZ0823774.1 hypothetical protein [Dickeya solani]MDV6996233.1 hypothetical protein [Dickeya solani]MDV7005372.1 hypothetical protein [Dickeya solani]MDV7037588.1 hypothetical protein [Dickeya solani]
MSNRSITTITPENGEQIINYGIYHDTHGALIDAVALNAAGNEIPLSKGMINFYSSPLSDGDFWRVIDSGSWQQQSVRIKIVKYGIPINVDRIVIVITRGQFSQPGIPQGAFTGTRFIGVQDLKACAIKNGNLFTASRLIPNVAANASTDSLIITGSKPVILLERRIGYSGLGVAASIYRDATYTGTPVAADVQNPNDINPAANLFTLSTGITFSTGTLTVATAYSQGNGSNQGQGNSQAILGEMVIMKPNTPYILRSQSLETTNTQNLNAYISLIEGWPDIPL